ncbi:MAG: TIM barrel protein [Chloroflexi bacterium]|jgi:mannonate dehydratase|nr:TIM barrel protein [Chloroflexota bacterium]
MTAQPANARGTWKPKICENMPDLSDRTLRWAAQLGLDTLALGGNLADPEHLGYWTVENCRAVSERVGEYGLSVGIMMLHNVTRRIILGLPGRDEDLEQVLRSIRAAAAAGYPVIEYNFYNHRGVEGYGQRPGRGGALYTDYDNARLEAQPLLPDEERLTPEETWDRLRYFLQAVVPVADEVGVRLALHPNDPPPPISRGTAQVAHGFEGMKKVVELVPGVSNGITFCQGSFAEWGVDVVKAIHYFGERDKIHHVHYRNPIGTFPAYVEPFIDEGDTNMLAAMKAYRDVNYRFTLCSDHVPHMTDDIGNGLIGRAFNHGYIRAMIQAVNRLP